MRVRFTEAADIEKYGAGPWTYDEYALLTLPARELIALEREMDSPLAAVMDGFRVSSTFGDLAAIWLARRQAGVIELFDTFSPAVRLAEWESVPAVEPGKEEPPASRPEVSPADGPESAATVSLPTMPPAEQST